MYIYIYIYISISISISIYLYLSIYLSISLSLSLSLYIYIYIYINLTPQLSLSSVYCLPTSQRIFLVIKKVYLDVSKTRVKAEYLYIDTLFLPDHGRWISSRILYIYFLVFKQRKSTWNFSWFYFYWNYMPTSTYSLQSPFYGPEQHWPFSISTIPLQSNSILIR